MMSHTRTALQIKNSNKKLCMTGSSTKSKLQAIVTRKEYERNKKHQTITTTVKPPCPPPNLATRPCSTNKNHHSIYKLPLQRLQTIEHSISQQMRSINKLQVHKQNIDTEMHVAEKLLFQLDKFVLLDLYCRSFQLVEKDVPNKDISWVRLMKR